MVKAIGLIEIDGATRSSVPEYWAPTISINSILGRVIEKPAIRKAINLPIG